ncbi:nicotinate-nucleotide adenylyltransferase [Planococcus antarcticus DSM 14505]|uniref:Probable nicotinate-nucleotide adenylyltransferase n=1 Tax=Planococcus antarcticus DSM 14505 TaxID=1185653 RepID=A0A1C7DIL9_9BACL|nr:nicotinate-nucleotide adenylyltransferase [Planococcus antarcticus]ANU11257.1 nicotinate (nicotinamide) nucleotide adenylyltransferase [Planococcus antarcticus DSM 14505]EIM07891.1 nicotinate-nucleotide adenylyltransferase [Planococcus antarcticus DSM 14505]
MKKVGILGGTFNPPHLGHLIMANEAYYSVGLDEVRFMPNFIAPHKEVAGASAEQRLTMTQLATAGHPHFRVEDFEINSGGVSYSFDTLTKLTGQEPDAEFFFIIGGDMIEGLPSWHRIDELIKLIRFIGVKRSGYNIETPYPVMMIESPELLLSSTMLRERAANRPLTFLVPEKVEAFIRKERLYGSQPNASSR